MENKNLSEFIVHVGKVVFLDPVNQLMEIHHFKAYRNTYTY